MQTHTWAHTYDVVIAHVQETKARNIATQRDCGLHSHGFSEWTKSGCVHGWQQYWGWNYGQKWRHVPLLRQRVRRTLSPAFELVSLFFLKIMTNTHTTLAKSWGVWGSSQWCRACPEKIWGICNPEADLERQIHTGYQWYKIIFHLSHIADEYCY